MQPVLSRQEIVTAIADYISQLYGFVPLDVRYIAAEAAVDSVEDWQPVSQETG